MASLKRFFFSGPPFEYLAARLTQDPEFLEDAQLILNLDEDAYLRLATQLAKADDFLSRPDVDKIVHESLGADSDRIAAVIFRTAGIIHDSGMDSKDAMKEFANAIEGNATGLELNQRMLLIERLKRLAAEPSGLAKQFKARQLVEALGAELEDFRIICDIRPVFDQNRERVDGAIPISILRLEYSAVDGDSSVVELHVTEKQISQLTEKLADAKRKIVMIKEFLSNHLLPMPNTKATFAEDESQ